MTDLLINILASIIYCGMAFTIGWLWGRLKDRYNLVHISRLIGDKDCIKIVVPGSRITTLKIVDGGKTHEAKIPANNLAMGMSEGQALGEILSVIHRVSPKTTILIVPANRFDDDNLPFISIGGPSINVVARRYLAKAFPPFLIKYPEHFAKWPDSATYDPNIENENLTEDFGFIFSGTEGDTRFVLLFGVWAFGTLIAARSFLSIKRGSEIYKAWVKPKNTAITVHAEVMDYFINHWKVLDIRKYK